MIDRWTILHLEKRKDRAPLAFSNAERLGVPREKVRFWDAKDADGFENVEAIFDAAVSDGFEEFGNLTRKGISYPGRVCQTWNVCRFLRDLAERDGIEMLIHDGMLIKHMSNDPLLFYPDFEWFCDVVTECVKKRARFKMLAIGTLNPYTKIEPIRPGSLILKGVVSNSTSIRIYSSVGAREVLKRIRGQVAIGRFDADQVLFEANPEREPICWSLPGMYTLLMQPIARDMPHDYLGSNSVNNMRSYQGVYSKIFA